MQEGDRKIWRLTLANGNCQYIIGTRTAAQLVDYWGEGAALHRVLKIEAGTAQEYADQYGITVELAKEMLQGDGIKPDAAKGAVTWRDLMTQAWGILVAGTAIGAGIVITANLFALIAGWR